MRAIVYDTFGGPDVLHLQGVALPEPGPGQVRVAIYAAGTNPVDAGNRQDGSWAGVHPPVIPGCDASGVIDAVGPGVTLFSPGDEVFYMADFLNNSRGTYAEYHVIDAALIARKPQTLTHVEAAALPLAAGTAYETMVHRLALTQGEWVLLYGAAGRVGSLALQMAVAQGTQVIAGRKLDAVADFVGGEMIARSLDALRPFGRAASIVGVKGDLDPLLDMNLTLHSILVRSDQARLETLHVLVAIGALRPIIDQVLPLEEAAQAHRRLKTRHGRGKIVLAVR
jgi:NADPH2:quinone reductase